MSGITTTKPTLIIQKKFPSGFFFATSGLFFGLTLLVIFLSDDPAGLPAAVAYISCLIISITSAFAPFIASYFINLDLRLHQIEGAIVDLGLRLKELPSDRHLNQNGAPVSNERFRTESPHPSRPVEVEPNNTPFDPDSIEESDHASPRLLTDSKGEESEPLLPSGSTEGPDAQENLASKPPSKAKKGLSKDKQEAQETQLSLFSFEDADEQEILSEPKIPDEINTSSGQLTRIVAYILMENDASLHLVGDYPFSWEEARELNRIEVGTYLCESNEVLTKTRIAFQSSNNRGAHRSAVFELKPGITNELYPEFASD